MQERDNLGGQVEKLQQQLIENQNKMEKGQFTNLVVLSTFRVQPLV